MHSIIITNINRLEKRTLGVMSTYTPLEVVEAWSRLLTSESRYHVPARIQEHVDYITPGLKLLTPSKSRSKSDRNEIEKRIFGVTATNHPILPPMKKAIPDSLANLLKMDLTAVCNVAVLPFCIQSELWHICTMT